MAAALARLDCPCKLDGARKQQQFLSQCGLAGVWMGNDAEGTTPGDFSSDQFKRDDARLRGRGGVARMNGQGGFASSNRIGNCGHGGAAENRKF